MLVAVFILLLFFSRLSDILNYDSFDDDED